MASLNNRTLTYFAGSISVRVNNLITFRNLSAEIVAWLRTCDSAVAACRTGRNRVSSAICPAGSGRGPSSLSCPWRQGSKSMLDYTGLLVHMAVMFTGPLACNVGVNCLDFIDN